MSFALKQQKNEINLFTSLVYHISLCVFLTLLIIRNAAIAINILVYVIGNTLSTFTRQFIMIAAERSASIAKSCLVLVEFLAVNYIKYIDFDDQKQKVPSEKGSIKNILTNASKRVQVPVKKGVTGSITAAPNTPVVSPEFLRKSEAARQIRTSKSVNKPTEATPVNSNFSALSLRKAEKEKLPLEKRYRSTVPSSLGNRPNDLKSVDYCPSKRYSTPSSDAPKRTITMKFINSTAANRVTKRKKQRHHDDDDDVEIVKQQKFTTKQKQKPEEINLNLSDERPSISKPSHTLYLNKPPEIYLQVARRYLKAMIKVKKHRNTI